MKIAIVSDYFQAVIGYAKPQIARQLIQQGHTVKVITSDRYFPFANYQTTRQDQLGPRRRSVGTFREHGVHVQRLPVAAEMFARTHIVGLEAAVTKYRPELVIVFGISSPSAIRMARLKRPKRDHRPKQDHFKLVLVDSHLPSELQLEKSSLKQVMYGGFRALFARELDVADKFIALQDDTVGIIKEVYGVDRDVEVVDNGTDPQLFRFSARKRRELRHRLSIGSDNYVVIYTGKVVPAKGVHLLTQAFAEVLSQLPESWCAIVGDGPAEYRQQCLAGLPDNVTARIRWTGNQPHQELLGYYSLADVAVWPLQESLAMNDSASCSRPFIANHRLGAKTRISNDNALLYKQGDAADLAKRIIELGRDPARREAMGRRGRQLVETKLNWASIARRFLV
ncbi:MAG: hypothetical protein COU69_00010 [Candidatus Pacebacteria bacterium CG10_big_fil_rev_8_21_14_0_10_56_10]|nr:MAG: hypothetical protein COU69_00010 [Candidatus Pacebacteria bacterium CG10_big_fil_rev_8_21_14_0_10_56_10]